MIERYNNYMKVAYLKEECQRHKLYTIGYKRDLVNRLNKFVTEQKTQETSGDIIIISESPPQQLQPSTSASGKTTAYSNTECSICNNDYNDYSLKPFMINPCGHTYCKTCLDRMERMKSKCPECRGPITSKIENRFALNLMADMRLNNLLNSKRLDAKEKFDKIQALVNKLNKEPDTSHSNSVSEYFTCIKKQVNVHCEETIQGIINKSIKIIESLDTLEKEAENMGPSVEKANLAKLQTTNIPEWEKQLKNEDININQVEDLLKQLNKSVADLEKSPKKFELDSLMNKKVQFKPTAVDGKLFGNLSIICRQECLNGYYSGEFADGKYNGHGEFHFKNGDIFIGDWQNSHKYGKGVYNYANGDRYNGDYKDGNRDGNGTFYYTNGDRFEGTYLNDKPNEGIYYFKEGAIQRIKYQDGQMVNC